MFGIGFAELLVIAIVAIVFIGPDKLPEAIKTVARFFFDFKRTVDDVKESVGDSIREVRDSVEIDPGTGIADSLKRAALDPAKGVVNGIRADIERDLIRDIEAKRLKASLDLNAPDEPPIESGALGIKETEDTHHEATKVTKEEKSIERSRKEGINLKDSEGPL